MFCITRSNMSRRLMTLMLLVFSGLALLHTAQGWLREPDENEDWAAAGFVDTNLSFLSFLELYRTDVAQRRMTPPGVVEALDVIEHIRPGLLSAAVDLPGNALRFH